MAAPKRTEAQRQADLVEISKLNIYGLGLREIAQKIAQTPDITGNPRGYTLSFQTIGNDVNDILGRWRETINSEIGELRAAELSRINRMELEAWDAWTKSKAAATSSMTVRDIGSSKPDKLQVKSEEQYGDPRFFAVIQWCIDKRSKLLGLDMPTKQEVTGAGGGPCVIEVVYEKPVQSRG